MQAMLSTSSTNRPPYIKLALIGNSSVGKSCLLSRFLDNRLIPEGGLTITDYRAHVMEVKRKKVKIGIWDTAGQERFRTIAPSYYRGVQGIILVYDISDRTTFDSMPSWYDELDIYVSSPAVKIVVGNKMDKEFSRQVSTKEGRQFAGRHGSLFVEASAMTAVGVEEVFTSVVEKILDTPELWSPASEAQSTGGGNGDALALVPYGRQAPGSGFFSGCACF